MREIVCEQNSSEWIIARNGRVTASRVADVIDRLKSGGEGASRRNYRMELVAERLTGRSEDHYTSTEMIWGTENEPYARAAYEVSRNVMVDKVGFFLHPTMDFCGGSPDGLVDQDGLIEIKCGKTTTHLKWMLNGVVPPEHEAQMLWNLCCTGRKWADFISYDPRLPDDIRMLVVRMERDEKRISEIEQEVIRFDEEVNALIAEIGMTSYKPSYSGPKPEQTADEMLAELNEYLVGDIIP